MKNKFNTIAKMLFTTILVGSVFVGCASGSNKQGAVETTPAEVKTADQTATTTDKKTLTMGTNAAFQPFEYVNPDGSIVGFDIDLSKLIAEKVGAELKIEDVPFESLLVMLDSGKVDFVAAGMTADDERRKSVDFSDTYFSAKQMVLVLEGDDTIKTQADLAGKKIGVQSATTGEQVADKIEGATVFGLDNVTQAAIQLQQGKIDAVIIDLEPAKRVVAANTASDKPIKMVDVGFDEELYAIAVKKGNTELLNQINEVIKQARDSGQYDTLIKQYFE